MLNVIEIFADSLKHVALPPTLISILLIVSVVLAILRVNLLGTLLVLDSDQIPAPDDPDEFYDHQLIGLRVVTAAGLAVGQVANVLHHGQDLLVVRRDDGGADEVLVPFVSAIVTDVNTAAHNSSISRISPASRMRLPSPFDPVIHSDSIAPRIALDPATRRPVKR